MFFFLFPADVRAGIKIVTVQSMRIPPYEAVLQGFKTRYPAPSLQIVLSETSPENHEEIIRNASPDLVFAIGLSALETAASAGDFPIVFCMVLPQDTQSLDLKNATGIFMQVPADIQLKYIMEILPSAVRIGVLYNAGQSSNFIKEAQLALRGQDIELVAEAVTTPATISEALSKMSGRIDVVWMLPDLTVTNPHVMEFFTLFSFENQIPIVTYSEKSLMHGAFMSVETEPFEMGRQAAAMADSLLSKGSVLDIPPEDADSAVVILNKTIAEKFGIEISGAMIERFKMSEGGR